MQALGHFLFYFKNKSFFEPNIRYASRIFLSELKCSKKFQSLTSEINPRCCHDTVPFWSSKCAFV